MPKIKIKNFEIGDKVRIDIDFLEFYKLKQPKKEQKELDSIIKKGGLTKIIGKQSGNSLILDDGAFYANTQYLIEFRYFAAPDHIIKKLGNGIPLSKIHKVMQQ